MHLIVSIQYLSHMEERTSFEWMVGAFQPLLDMAVAVEKLSLDGKVEPSTIFINFASPDQ